MNSLDLKGAVFSFVIVINMLFASSTDNNLLQVKLFILSQGFYYLLSYKGFWNCHGQLSQPLVLLFDTNTKVTRAIYYKNFKKTHTKSNVKISFFKSAFFFHLSLFISIALNLSYAVDILEFELSEIRMQTSKIVEQKKEINYRKKLSTFSVLKNSITKSYSRNFSRLVLENPSRISNQKSILGRKIKKVKN